MPSTNGPRDPVDQEPIDRSREMRQTIESQLFESLVHHLIEKGILTKNDALSVVHTVTQVHRGSLEELAPETAATDQGLARLARLLSSFELMSDRNASQLGDGDNVLQLRPPVHGDRPDFTSDD